MLNLYYQVAKLTPKYEVGCKRLLICSDFLPMFTKVIFFLFFYKTQRTFFSLEKVVVRLISSYSASGKAFWIEGESGLRICIFNLQAPAWFNFVPG
jgi:hypothetical protein